MQWPLSFENVLLQIVSSAAAVIFLGRTQRVVCVSAHSQVSSVFSAFKIATLLCATAGPQQNMDRVLSDKATDFCWAFALHLQTGTQLGAFHFQAFHSFKIEMPLQM